jgi:aryl-alcohol dehydrogenase-like predicted oxidoreductase
VEKIILGKTGLRVSRLGFGCSRIASLAARHSSREIIATLEEAVAEGINFFDTAAVYGQGDSERMLGRLCRGRRDKLVLCTKAGLHIGPLQQIVRMAKPFLRPVLTHLSGTRRQVTAQRVQAQQQCFDASYLEKQFHGSLRRLRTDYVDVFLLHSPSSIVIENESVWVFLQRVVESGRARYVGVSCAESTDIDLWLQEPLIAVFQVQASLWNPEALAGPVPRAHSNGVGIILREVLHHAVDDGRAKGRPGVDRSVLEVAIRYLVERSQPELILIGMSCREHLRSNLAAFRARPLSAEEMDEIQRWQRQICRKQSP